MFILPTIHIISTTMNPCKLSKRKREDNGDDNEDLPPPKRCRIGRLVDPKMLLDTSVVQSTTSSKLFSPWDSTTMKYNLFGLFLNHLI